VSDVENTTRDILEYQKNDTERDISYVIADSGGLNAGTKDEILQDVRKRAEESVKRSELIVFVVEYDKITSLDEEIARMLRKSGKAILLVGNKVDNAKRAHEAYELLSLGFGEPILTSASQNSGFTKLADAIIANLKKL
jgi:GTP-binding protein